MFFVFLPCVVVSLLTGLLPAPLALLCGECHFLLFYRIGYELSRVFGRESDFFTFAVEFCVVSVSFMLDSNEFIAYNLIIL